MGADHLAESGGRDGDEALLREQLAYYRARAPEYDEWWLRKGRYDHGPEANAAWFAEIDTAVRAFEAAPIGGETLELACGTGLWTARLARRAASLTCVDGAPEALDLNRRRLAGLGAGVPVRHVEADLFAFVPDRAYDTVFFSFWLSHVPERRFDAFWAMVRRAVRPDGLVFLVDSLYAPESTARDHVLGDEADTVRWRVLNDGRRFQVVKRFDRAEALAARLANLGLAADLRETATHFLYGSVRRVQA